MPLLPWPWLPLELPLELPELLPLELPLDAFPLDEPPELDSPEDDPVSPELEPVSPELLPVPLEEPLPRLPETVECSRPPSHLY